MNPLSRIGCALCALFAPAAAIAAAPPGFVNLDRQDGADRVVIQTTVPVHADIGSHLVIAGELYVQQAFATPVGIVGGYVQLPAFYAFNGLQYQEGSTMEFSEGGVADLELGAHYAGAVRDFGYVLHTGVALPKLSGFDSVFGGSHAAVLAAAGRITDYATLLPGAFLRSAGSASWRAEVFFFRADLGVDVSFAGLDGVAFIARLNGGAGISPWRHCDLTLELQSLVFVGTGQTVLMATLGAQLRYAFVAVSLPVVSVTEAAGVGALTMGLRF